MRDATRIVRAGLPAPAAGQPLLPGPTFASVYHLPGDPTATPYQYGRYHNPTWSAFEQALGELEGGPSVAFASGMAAVVAVLGTVLEPGGELVIVGDAYYTARSAAARTLPERGVGVRVVPQGEPIDALAGCSLLWIETPSNPSLNGYDIAELSERAHAAGALLLVDNTTATVASQRPLELGADFSLASDTKALTGHGDLVLGHVATRGPEWAERLRAWRTESGSVPGPMEVWLAHRSLATLDVRLERMCRSAQEIAEYLAGRPDVGAVRYPGLVDDPTYAVAARQMKRFGSIVSFELRDAAAGQAFLAASRLITEATSFGGVHSTAERRARWGGDAVAEGFVRLSVGCEDAADLLEDLAQALDHASA